MARRSELEGVNLLDLAPVRLAEWDEADGRVVLYRPRNHRRFILGLLDRLTWTLSAKRVRLDDLGSFAWKRLDGRATVAEVARALRAELGEPAEPAEERLGDFVRLLRREGFLAYPGFDDV